MATSAAQKNATPSKSQLKTAKSAWLYPNGTVILVHEKEDPDAGTVSFYTLWKTDIKVLSTVGLTFRQQNLACIWKGLHRVEVYRDNGSQSTRDKGIYLDTISLCFDGYELDFHLFPGLINSEIDLSSVLAEESPDYDACIADGWFRTFRLANRIPPSYS